MNWYLGMTATIALFDELEAVGHLGERGWLITDVSLLLHVIECISVVAVYGSVILLTRLRGTKRSRSQFMEAIVPLLGLGVIAYWFSSSIGQRLM